MPPLCRRRRHLMFVPDAGRRSSCFSRRRVQASGLPPGSPGPPRGDGDLAPGDRRRDERRGRLTLHERRKDQSETGAAAPRRPMRPRRAPGSAFRLRPRSGIGSVPLRAGRGRKGNRTSAERVRSPAFAYCFCWLFDWEGRKGSPPQKSVGWWLFHQFRCAADENARLRNDGQKLTIVVHDGTVRHGRCSLPVQAGSANGLVKSAPAGTCSNSAFQDPCRAG